MKKMHKTQIGILNKLLFAKQTKYSDLKIDPTIENNTFQFHMDAVIKEGFIKKNKDGLYSLTTKGKKLATHIDTDRNRVVSRGKISVRMFCIREINNQKETLIYKRLKHPFFGKQGYPAGKVDIGEKFIDTARRELLEETNLSGDPKLFKITHYLVKDSKTKDILDDKLFINFFFQNPTGELNGNDEGEFTWIPVEDFASVITNPFDSVEVYLKDLEEIENYNGTVIFDELEHFTSEF